MCLTKGAYLLPFTDNTAEGIIKVRDVLPFTRTDWINVQNIGKKSLSALDDAYEHFGFYFGMTKSGIAALEENNNTEEQSPTLSFQDYINTLKQFADNAGACAITNEFVTEDGYKISFKIEKTTK